MILAIAAVVSAQTYTEEMFDSTMYDKTICDVTFSEAASFALQFGDVVTYRPEVLYICMLYLYSVKRQ